MSLEENEAIIRKWIEALNKQNLALLDDIIAPDYVDMKQQGLESAKQSMKMFYKGFPDLHTTIEDMIAEGEKVWVRVKATGTHTGEFLGLIPTGKKITITSVDIFRIADDKIVQGWSVNDFLDFYKQLGVIEYTELPDEVEELL